MPERHATRRLPSVEYLRECFVYDRKSGELIWKERPREHFATERACSTWNATFVGEKAGFSQNRGYIAVAIANRKYLIHRVIWKLETGEDPLEQIDHRDGVRTNNSWANLRVATGNEQSQNSGRRSDNVSGQRGVSWDRSRGKWAAEIISNGVRHRLGRFNSIADASAAYEAAAQNLFGVFYRHPQQR